MGELEDKVKDLEQKVANLFMDNVALKTKLEASQEVERQQHEEIAHLKERLVQALRTQVNMRFWDLYCVYLLLSTFCFLRTCSCAQQDTATKEQSLLRTRESQLKEKIKVLEEARSDLETEVEKYEKQMKQLEILPSDIEQLTKVHFHITYSSFVCLCACLHEWVHACDPLTRLPLLLIQQLSISLFIITTLHTLNELLISG